MKNKQLAAVAPDEQETGLPSRRPYTSPHFYELGLLETASGQFTGQPENEGTDYAPSA